MLMKKTIALIISLIFIFTCGLTYASQYADYVADVNYHYKMSMNQDTVISVDDGDFHKTAGQYIKDNTLMVNATELLPLLGFIENNDKKGMFSSDAFQYLFADNDNVVVTGGNGYQAGMRMEQAASYKNGSLYLPLSFVIQLASDNTKASYDDKKNNVKLYTFNSQRHPSVKTDQNTKIYIDGHLISFDNVYTVTPKNNYETFPQTLMVPLYEVMPKVGGTATYDSANSTTVARNDLDTICFPIYASHKYFDFRNSSNWSNYRPEINNGHVYVPVTVINSFVDWSKTIYDEKNNMIKFYSVK